METAAGHPLVFRRGRIRRTAYWLVIVGGWIAEAGLAVFFISVLFEPGLSGSKLASVALIMSSAVGIVSPLLWLAQWNRECATNRLVIDDAGVHGRLGDRKVDLKWEQIRGVSHVRRATHVYTLSTDQQPVSFTVMDIPGPKRAARAVAGRLGVPIEEIVPESAKKHRGVQSPPPR